METLRIIQTFHYKDVKEEGKIDRRKALQSDGGPRLAAPWDPRSLRRQEFQYTQPAGTVVSTYMEKLIT